MKEAITADLWNQELEGFPVMWGVPSPAFPSPFL